MSDKVENRNRAVLDAALECAARGSYRDFTRSDVAAIAGVAVGSVNNAFGTMDALRDAVVVAAVEREILPIIAAAMVDKHPGVICAPEALKLRALSSSLA